jgi:integrase
MVDVRKRVGDKGTTYQVRYASRSAKSGYAYKTFATAKAARHYVENELPKHRSDRHQEIRTVDQAIQKWLDTCELEGRDGKDPISPATFEGYEYRAGVMRAYYFYK